VTYKVINMAPLPTRTEKLVAVDHSPMLPSLSEGCPSTDQLPLFSFSGDSSTAEYPTDMDNLEEINPHSSPINKFEEYTTVTPSRYKLVTTARTKISAPANDALKSMNC